MAEQERSEQELTPGYYDSQFGYRVDNISKGGSNSNPPSGGSSGGWLKGGGGLIFAVFLVLRLAVAGCRDTSSTNYSPYCTPPYQSPPRINMRQHDDFRPQRRDLERQEDVLPRDPDPQRRNIDPANDDFPVDEDNRDGGIIGPRP